MGGFMGTLPPTQGSTVISYQVPELNRSMGQQAPITNGINSNKNGTTFSKMTSADSTDATTVAQTFSANSAQTQAPNVGNTVYSATTALRYSEQNLSKN